MRSNYTELERVLSEAVAQAATGKGRERHAVEGERFEDQQICQLGRWMGGHQGPVFQAVKKSLESTRLPPDRAKAELLGAAVVIAALYVCGPPRGVYFGLDGVDPWDEARDARNYAGPYPVVAHPPCQRWGRYWHGGPNSARFPRERKLKGDDGGCFAAALAAVRRWGGVLEHPAASAAWDAFDLLRPPHDGGWVWADWQGGWTCHVEQGHYGHRARKATWLYACRVAALPSLIWGASQATARLDDGFHTAAERAVAPVERLSKHERLSTPLPFRDLLLGIARSVAQ